MRVGVSASSQCDPHGRGDGGRTALHIKILSAGATLDQSLGIRHNTLIEEAFGRAGIHAVPP